MHYIVDRISNMGRSHIGFLRILAFYCIQNIFPKKTNETRESRFFIGENFDMAGNESISCLLDFYILSEYILV